METYELVRNVMNEAQLSGDICEATDEKVQILIEWGDWKHDHLHLKYVMGKNGYTQIEEKVTEENGCDCYSSLHTFVKRPHYNTIITIGKNVTDIMRLDCVVSAVKMPTGSISYRVRVPDGLAWAHEGNNLCRDDKGIWHIEEKYN